MPAAAPDTYWIEPGRVLAGPYPGGDSHPHTLMRLRALLSAGVTAFLDLTEPGEQAPYAHLLAAIAAARGREVAYLRKALPDHRVPASRAVMVDIQQTLARLLAEGHCVYLHCRAGIGRTGMVVGCFLIQCGMDPARALERLQALWEESGRSAVWPHTPETDEQIDYVRRWTA